MAITAAFFADAEFQDSLLALLCTDAIALAQCGSLLSVDDFQPVAGVRDGQPRWIVAGRAVSYWQKYHVPVGRLLRSDVLGYAEKLGMGERQKKLLQQYLNHLSKASRTNPEAIIDQIVQYKVQRLRAGVIEEMTRLHSAGELGDEQWTELFRKGQHNGNYREAVDHFDNAELENRIERRLLERHSTATPCFLIEPLDNLVQGIGPGHVAVVIAPTKRGKSLMLIWMGASFAVQGINVLYFTLEDPKLTVEDRLDAAISGIPLHELSDDVERFRKGFQKSRRNIKAQMRIVDGVDRGLTVHGIDAEIMRYRAAGYNADAVIIDYDEYLLPSKRLEKRSEEFDQIYRDLKRIAARHNLILWTAAQTQRDTEHLKILAGDRVADAIGKIRKCSMALSLGKSDWGENAIYIYVAAHKLDNQHIGCNIMSDKPRMMIYDAEATRDRAQQELENYDSEL